MPNVSSNNPDMQPLNYHGLYRGEIVSREDPLKLGRCKVTVYQVYHGIGVEDLPWAWPMFSASPKGGFFHIPPVGSTVWVQFEMGDPDHPVWCQGWWGGPGGANETPDEGFKDLVPDGHVWRTPKGNMIVLDDREGQEQILIQDKDENYIKFDSEEETLEVKHAGDLKVEIEGDAEVKIDGDLKAEIGGDVEAAIDGKLEAEVKGRADIKVRGNANIEASGILTLKGAIIQEN